MECRAVAPSDTDLDAGCREPGRPPPCASRGAEAPRRCSRARSAGVPRADCPTARTARGRDGVGAPGAHARSESRRRSPSATTRSIAVRSSARLPGQVSAPSSASAGCVKVRGAHARLPRSSPRAAAPPAPAHRRGDRAAAAGRCGVADSRRNRSPRNRCACTSPSMPGCALATQPELGGDGLAVDAHLAVARNPRQPRLRRGAQFGNIVQEQRAAARRRDAAVGATGSRSVGAVGQQARRTAGDRRWPESRRRRTPSRTVPRPDRPLVQLASDTLNRGARFRSDQRLRPRAPPHA